MADGKAEIASWFATPVATATLPDCEGLNRELETLFLARENAGDEFRTDNHIPTQVGDIFESRFDLFDWPDPPVQTLADHCHRMLFNLVASLNGYSDAEMARFDFHYHAWFHITRRGGYQSIHYHPNASWSGIYCVHAGDPVAERPESGAVKFYDPRGPVFMHVDPANERPDPRYGATPVYLTHTEGRLVMFPSWLMHEVLPYHGKRERIVVAFNAWLTKSEQHS